MTLQKDFDKFLADIEPSDSTVANIKRYHTTLRDYLSNHETFGVHCLEIFLSGSYARHTMVRPALNDGKRDVDVDVVTDYSHSDSPKIILEDLEKVLLERSAYWRVKLQSHSVGIEMEGMDIDVVPLIRDRAGNLFIGDGETNEWSKTNPKRHADWATEINQNFDGCYKPLVKIFKWWRRENAGDFRYPKGITLEKIIADNLPDRHETMEADLLQTMQTTVDELSQQLNMGLAPFVQDLRSFVKKLEEHLDLIETEGASNATWRKILGDRFPLGANTTSKKEDTLGYETASVLTAPHKKQSIWPMQRGQKARIVADVTYQDGSHDSLTSGEVVLPKRCEINFRAVFSSSLQPCKVYWQIVNTGQEAAENNGLRGGFDSANFMRYGRHETTEYLGAHSIECYIIRKGVCVAKSDPFFVYIE